MFEEIDAKPGDWYRGDRSDIKFLTNNDRDQIVELLMGRRVLKVDREHVLLDDGTTLKMLGHDGGCSCSAGCYDLTELNGIDNIITRVEFEDAPGGDDYGGRYYGHYRIWVYAENRKVNLMTVEGTDGNGYYGTGYEIAVRPPLRETEEMKSERVTSGLGVLGSLNKERPAETFASPVTGTVRLTATCQHCGAQAYQSRDWYHVDTDSLRCSR